MVIINLKTEGQTRNRKPHHKTQSKILPRLWLSESGTEQPGQGATLLGWPKSIYYLKSDILLLTDVFQNFRETCLTYYGLDPPHYVSSPGSSVRHVKDD